MTSRAGTGITLCTILAVVAMGLLPSVAQASISVKPWPSGGSVVFGKKKYLEVKVSGYSSDELAGGRIIIRQAEFPYDDFKVIADVQASDALRYVPIKPRVNSRYQASFVGINAGGEAASTTVYVNPTGTPPRDKWERSGVWRFSPYSLVFSSSLARRWRMLSTRRASTYFYAHCQSFSYLPGEKRFAGRSAVYHLVGRVVPKITVRGEKVVIRWPSFRYHMPCYVGTLESLTFGKLPGYLNDGDDGAGDPGLTVRQYRKRIPLLGKSKIPRWQAQTYFGWP